MNAHANFNLQPKALPSDVEAEQALLGILLYDVSAFDRMPNGLKADHFHEPLHGRIYAALEGMAAAGRATDATIVGDRLKGDPAFEEMGANRYLADMMDHAPPTFAAPEYAGIVHRLAMRRELIRIADELAAAAETDSETDPKTMVEAAEGALYALVEPTAGVGGFQPLSGALTAALDTYAAAYARDGKISGVATGLIDLDQKLGGFHPSDLLILAGRPSMGKTALATNIAFSVARSYAWELLPDGTRKTVAGGVVGFFSLEMSAEQLGGRLLAEVSGVPSDRLRRGDFDKSEFSRVRDAADEIAQIPLHIDATGAISLAKLCARARRLKRTKGLDLLVVDYLQLVTSPGERGQGRVQEITAITSGLKALAKELGIPVLALSQLSRQVENRDDKRPQLSDLRESGSIEQDADAVMFVYREEYYLGRAEPKTDTPQHIEWEEKLQEVQGLAEVIIGKQRHGPIGTVRLHFNQALTKFENLARGDRYSPDQSTIRLPYARDE